MLVIDGVEASAALAVGALAGQAARVGEAEGATNEEANSHKN